MAARELRVDTVGDDVRVQVDGVELHLPFPSYVEPQLVVDTRRRELRITIAADRITVDGRRTAG